MRHLLPILTATTLTGFAVPAAASSTSDQWGILQSSTVFMQNNLFNPAPGAWSTIWIDQGTGYNWDMKNTNGGVRGYPSLVRGFWGSTWSNNSGLPVKVNANKNIWLAFKWGFNGPTSGNYNSLIEAWFYPTSNLNGDVSVELGVLPYISGTNGPFGTDTGRNLNVWDYSIGANRSYRAYRGWASWNNGGRGSWFITYRCTNTTATDCNFRDFVNDAKAAGWLNGNHYMGSVQMGHELVDGSGNIAISSYKCDM